MFGAREHLRVPFTVPRESVKGDTVPPRRNLCCGKTNTESDTSRGRGILQPPSLPLTLYSPLLLFAQITTNSHTAQERERERERERPMHCNSLLTSLCFPRQTSRRRRTRPASTHSRRRSRTRSGGGSCSALQVGILVAAVDRHARALVGPGD